MARPKTQAPDTCRMVIVIRGESYTARPVRDCTGDVARAWRLRKGDGTAYTVADTTDGATCECADFTFRHQGHDQAGCKHIRAMRALGLIDPDGDDPHDWPAWTDSHAFTVSQ